LGAKHPFEGGATAPCPNVATCLCACVVVRPSRQRADADLDGELVTSADESELDPLQWRDAGKEVDGDAMSNSNALDFDDDDDDDAAEWNKDFDRDSASPTSRRRGSRVRCVIVALLVALVIAGVCVAILLLHRRMQGCGVSNMVHHHHHQFILPYFHVKLQIPSLQAVHVLFIAVGL